MRVVHGEVGHDDGDGKGDGQHAADRAQAAHDHAQVSLDTGAEDRWVLIVVVTGKLQGVPTVQINNIDLFCLLATSSLLKL